jgi:acetyl esterase/lipase
VPFSTPPGADKPLLCDIWQPPAGTEPSGLAFIYFHGSAWHYLDKDFQTRPMFRHLAEQGHVIMDVAYRLCPEVDLYQMMGDTRQAIAWMKENAGRYGVNRKKIVVAGGSAGAHLALLAAYAPGHLDLTPADLQGVDTSVAGVVSWYGPVDLAWTCRHTLGTLGIEAAARKPSENPVVGFLDRIKLAMMKQAFAGGPDAIPYTLPEMFTHMLGDMPEAIPHTYALVSPMSHVGPNCPPTLLFQGDHDTLVPVTATREFYHRLEGADARVIYVELPQTEHGFDLVFPPRAPAAQAALYDVDRFLALLAAEEKPDENEHEHMAGGESPDIPYKLEPVGTA